MFIIGLKQCGFSILGLYGTLTRTCRILWWQVVPLNTTCTVLRKFSFIESSFGTCTCIIYWYLYHVHIRDGLIQHLFLITVSSWYFTDNYETWAYCPLGLPDKFEPGFLGWTVRPGPVLGTILITPFTWGVARIGCICYTLFASKSTITFNVMSYDLKEKREMNTFPAQKNKIGKFLKALFLLNFVPFLLWKSEFVILLLSWQINLSYSTGINSPVTQLLGDQDMGREFVPWFCPER